MHSGEVAKREEGREEGGREGEREKVMHDIGLNQHRQVSWTAYDVYCMLLLLTVTVSD